MARSKKSSIVQRREAQLEEVLALHEQKREQLRDLPGVQEQLALLESVSRGLYEEVDKLTKKAPSELVTDLLLEKVNDIIRETKLLARADSYIQKLNEFVAAGENPEHRDVIVILSQVRLGLERQDAYLGRLESSLRSQIRQLVVLKMVLEIYLSGDGVASASDVDVDTAHPAHKFFTGPGYPRTFNFDLINDQTISELLVAG